MEVLQEIENMKLLENIKEQKEKICVEIDSKIKCFKETPSQEEIKDCSKLQGLFFCPVKVENGTTLSKEMDKYVNILTRPKLSLDETIYIENKTLEFTIGFILSSLVFTLSFYIKDIIDITTLLIIPFTSEIISLIMRVVGLTLTALFLSVLYLRFAKANRNTKVLEQFAERTPRELISGLVTKDKEMKEKPISL